MDIQNLPAFIAASVIIMFIPGVDMALVTRQVVVHGRPAAFATLGGLLVGGLTHAAFATIGLSAVLLTSATAYTAVKMAGAVYSSHLVFRRSGQAGAPESAATESTTHPPKRPCHSGEHLPWAF